MKVLVACEFSGVVRDAFAAKGHDAWSCDLLPTEKPGQHRQIDVSHILNDGWDLMIAHPPCTFLVVAANRHMLNNPRRWVQRLDALLFIKTLLDCNIPRIALENPVGVISSHIRKPDQTIQPWQFGHSESKATCLWLKNLPLLKPTDVLEKPSERWDNQTVSGQNKLGPSDGRARIRSITYQGIANAMAEQWG